jgi:hypothetical protein
MSVARRPDILELGLRFRDDFEAVHRDKHFRVLYRDLQNCLAPSSFWVSSTATA